MRQRWAEHHGWRRRRLGRGGARGEGGNRGRRRPSPDPATMAGARPPHNAVAGEVEEEGGRRRRSPGPLPTLPVPRRLPAPSLPHRMPHAARRTPPGSSPPSPSHRNTHPAHAAPSAPRSPVPVPFSPLVPQPRPHLTSRHRIASPHHTSLLQSNRPSVAASFPTLHRRVLLLLGLLLLLLLLLLLWCVGEVVRLRLGAARPPCQPPPRALCHRLPSHRP
ncbi:hypothetical protein BS78_10G125400 [Paspalum vaginatum]|nr:hypothetical protein BS78_10G125400 [Paspalum vaginatum]